jgi:hypothetical protein
MSAYISPTPEWGAVALLGGLQHVRPIVLREYQQASEGYGFMLEVTDIPMLYIPAQPENDDDVVMRGSAHAVAQFFSAYLLRMPLMITL